MNSRNISTPGRGWAYIGVLVGGGISIAANIAHSFVPPAGALASWAPQPGAVIGSMFWPILLFVAVEILVRVAWPQGFWYALLRLGGLLPVAGVAALVSFRHLSALLTFYGEDPIVSFWGPLAIDGLMVMATAALLVTGRGATQPALSGAMQAVNPALTPMVGHSGQPPATTQRDTYSGVADVPAHLLSTARFAVANHANTTGATITADELAARMNINTELARRVLDNLGDAYAPVLNGTVTGGEKP